MVIGCADLLSGVGLVSIDTGLAQARGEPAGLAGLWLWLSKQSMGLALPSVASVQHDGLWWPGVEGISSVSSTQSEFVGSLCSTEVLQ